MKFLFVSMSELSSLDEQALWQRYGLALLAVALTVCLLLPLYPYLDLTNIAMLFLLVEVLVAVKWGRRPAILTAFVSVIVFNFFFVPPHWSIEITHVQYLITLIVMLLVALTITHLTEELRQLAIAAVGREQQALDLYRLEQEAQESKLQIANERLRSSILSALSHDIRTPLTSIYGLADTLKRSLPDLNSEARNNLIELQDQVFYLNNMVSNLLEMARLQAGNIKIRKEWQLIEDSISTSINALRPALKDHIVKVNIPDDLPLIEFDAVLMERVFCNLLENAAKYSPPHSTLTISAKLLPLYIEVCITSEGQGFPHDKLNQVFELFERGTNESTIPGVGLGLSICRAIIEFHKGTIYVKNNPEGGCSTCFTLPLGKTPEWNAHLVQLSATQKLAE